MPNEPPRPDEIDSIPFPPGLLAELRLILKPSDSMNPVGRIADTALAMIDADPLGYIPPANELAVLRELLRKHPEAGIAPLIGMAIARAEANTRSTPPPEASAATPKNKSKRTKGGRPRFSPEETEYRMGEIDEWKRARGAGVSAKDFCDGKTYSPKTLGKWQAWLRKRNSRA